MSGMVEAMPYQPEDDFLLYKVKDSSLLNSVRKRLNKNPEKLDVFIGSIKNLLKKARQKNSPLLFGEIESILRKHSDLVSKNNTLKVYLADVLQHRHAFEQAKWQLKQVNTAEANLMRASIFLNLGEYSKASKECKKLIGQTHILVASTCVLHTESYRGKLQQSYSALEKIFTQFKGENKLHQLWLITALAEMANRIGQYERSRYFYQKANDIKPGDAHILSEWVEVLYSLNKQNKIIELLEYNHQDIRLNLRYIRSLYARKKQHEVTLKELKKLKQGITILERRQDKQHYDTRAEYAIWISLDPEQAMKWASRNWQLAKTPESAKLLLMASGLANEKKFINEIKAWIRSSKIEDFSLMEMIAKLTSQELVV
ncbi:hypothetical protein JYT31_00740 [Beggiatoa alba]|nr:hypothetical protein [Beggiatoa alba]